MIAYAQLIDAVCAEFKITAMTLLSRQRAQKLFAPRAVLATILREQGLSYPAIGRILNREHATVMNLVNGGKGTPWLQNGDYRTKPKYRGVPCWMTEKVAAVKTRLGIMQGCYMGDVYDRLAELAKCA